MAKLKKFNDQDFEAIASRFRALSEVSRLKIIACLQSGEKTVNQIAEETMLSQPNVSRHLGTLAISKLIGRKKRGNNVMYRIIDASLGEICTIVCKSVLEK